MLYPCRGPEQSAQVEGPGQAPSLSVLCPDCVFSGSDENRGVRGSSSAVIDGWDLGQVFPGSLSLI